jgi:hypothetical protein
MDALGVGDAGPIRIPGAIDGPGLIVGGGGLGAIVMPGIGAMVGVGEGFATVGAGAAVLRGAGVAIGIPGMGAIVGCAAMLGETVPKTTQAAMLRRMASKGTSRGIKRTTRRSTLPLKRGFQTFGFTRHSLRRTEDA